MELWTEYEGRTIDGAFALKKLVQPQGRSAFFSTANGKGEPILIRLVACHFDEEEILARWRGVQALNHPNFLKLDGYGQLELDETKVVYAAFERTDANLAQVLAQGCLSAADARQLATSIAAALTMLHANGFIHEHVAAENVFAVGETVKLRTDCIRETPEGAEGLAAKSQDVRDLATLLLQALTQERTLEAAAARRRALPAPFDQIVPKGMSGAWGLAEITAALQTPERPPQSRPGAAPVPAPAPVAAAHSAGAARSAAAPPAQPAARAAREDDLKPAALRSQVLPGAWREDETEKKKWMGAAGLAAVMLLLLWAGWSVYHHRAHAAAVAAADAPVARAEHHDEPAARAAAPSRPAEAAGRKVWRVVAYTYDHEDEARKKAATVTQRHPELHAEVFSPSGHAPYLVTIGGALSRNQAYALAHRARSMGLPRDTYAQNYNSAR